MTEAPPCPPNTPHARLACALGDPDLCGGLLRFLETILPGEPNAPARAAWLNWLGMSAMGVATLPTPANLVDTLQRRGWRVLPGTFAPKAGDAWAELDAGGNVIAAGWVVKVSTDGAWFIGPALDGRGERRDPRDAAHPVAYYLRIAGG